MRSFGTAPSVIPATYFSGIATRSSNRKESPSIASTIRRSVIEIRIAVSSFLQIQ